jgi:hypothetical protein
VRARECGDVICNMPKKGENREMKKLFILGSGFSKSISNHMPTIIGLSEFIEKNMDQIPGDHEIICRLISDPEKLLSYLYQPMPWKSEEEVYMDKASFIILSKIITTYIIDCEERAFGEGVPKWSFDFVEYLHRNECTTATLNYDTFIERLARDLKPFDKESSEKESIDTSNLYRMPLASIRGRGNFTWGIKWYKTLSLLKLHGSINW